MKTLSAFRHHYCIVRHDTALRLYQHVERPALQQLPLTHFEYAEWNRCRAPEAA